MCMQKCQAFVNIWKDIGIRGDVYKYVGVNNLSDSVYFFVFSATLNLQIEVYAFFLDMLMTIL